MGDVAAGRKSIEEVTVILNKFFGIKPDSKLAGELAQQSVAINEVGVQTNGFADQVNAMGGVASKFKVAGNEIAAGAQVANAAIQKLTETQQKNIDLLKKQKGLMAGGLSSGVAEAVAKASAEGMSGEQLKKYTQLQQQQESLKRQIDNINSVTDTLKSLGKSADEARAELLGGKDGLTLFQLASKEATNAQMEQAKQYLAQSKAYKEQLQNQQTLQSMTQQMQEAYAELAGGKAGLIAFRLGMNHATTEQIRQAQALNSLTEAIQKQQSVMATLSSLQEQVATLGMDSVQRQLYSLRKEGATPEQLRQAENMLKQIKSFDEAQKDTKAAARDLSAAASALKDSSSTEDSTKPLSIFSKEYRDREEAYWTKKRQEERDGSNIGFLSGRPAVVPAWQNNGITQPLGFQNFNQSGKDEMLKPTEVIQVNLTNGGKNVTFKALFNQTGGAREFKELWNQTLHETARDLT